VPIAPEVFPGSTSDVSLKARFPIGRVNVVPDRRTVSKENPKVEEVPTRRRLKGIGRPARRFPGGGPAVGTPAPQPLKC